MGKRMAEVVESTRASFGERRGGCFPDVVLRRLRDSIEISWGPAPSAGMPEHFRFSESVRGVGRLAPRDVAEPLHDVLSNACDYLHSRAPESLRISALHRSIRNLNAIDESDPRLMWLAGLGTDEETVKTGWVRAKGVLAKLGAASRFSAGDPGSLTARNIRLMFRQR